MMPQGVFLRPRHCARIFAHYRHSVREARTLLAGVAGADIALATVVFVLTGGKCARLIERCLPAALPLGAFIVAAAEGRGLARKQ